MEVITIEKKTYEAMMERFRILTAKVDALCRESDEKRMGKWLDNQDACQILNVSDNVLSINNKRAGLRCGTTKRRVENYSILSISPAAHHGIQR